MPGCDLAHEIVYLGYDVAGRIWLTVTSRKLLRITDLLYILFSLQQILMILPRTLCVGQCIINPILSSTQKSSLLNLRQES